MVDTTANNNHRPRNIGRQCIRRLDSIQVFGRSGRKNTDAFRDAAIAQCNKSQHRDQDRGARNKNNTVEGIGNRDCFQPAENRVDAADNTKRHAHNNRRHKPVAAEQTGDIKNALHCNRARIQDKRKHGDDIGHKEDKRHDHARFSIIPVFQKLRDRGDPKLEILGHKKQRHQRQGNRAHGFPAHRRHAGCISLSISADQLLCRQVGHHQRAKNHPASQAAPAKEIAVLVGLIRIAGLQPADECHKCGHKHKRPNCKYHNSLSFILKAYKYKTFPGYLFARTFLLLSVCYAFSLFQYRAPN